MADDAPTAEQLLAHTDWLMQLARALVGDAGAADVVQDTYEVALTRPPRSAGPLRPWLGGVARNVARMTTRGRVRRQRREEQVPAAVEAPSPEDLVARVEAHQQVARIVLELPEPLRGTLLLRFFEGLTAAEIARVQRIPAATVRSRLKDALDRVRATLDQRHGDRRRWIALVAPYPLVAASSGSAATSLAGGLLVKTALQIVVGVIVILALVLGTRRLGWWGAPSEPDRSGKITPRSGAVARTGPVDRGAAAVHDDDPRGTLRLEGAVVDERDRPVAAAHVAIDANPPLIVETDADGGFAFDGLLPRDYRLEATAGEGYAGPARLHLTEHAEPVTLRLRRGGAVDVVVTDKRGGAPIAGAQVELQSTLPWRATTGTTGVAQLRGVGATWSPLVVHAPGFAPSATMLQTSGDPASPQRLAVALDRGAPIAGRVLDEAGKPVAGARVVAVSATDPYLAIDPQRDGVLTGDDGAFELASVAAGTWRLSATHADAAPVTSPPLAVDGATPRRDVELRLSPGAVVRGRVRDVAGNPVAIADVHVVVRGNVEWRARRQAVTDADGRFAIAGLPRRAVDVVAFHDAGATAVVAADLASARERELELVLDVTGAIEGIVVDRAGGFIADAQVVATPQWGSGPFDRDAWTARGSQRTVTDHAGRLRLTGLPPGTYELAAMRSGAVDAAMSLASRITARPGGAPVRIVLPGEGRVVGKVAFGDGKAPARFTAAVGMLYPRPFASPDGTFAVTATAGKQGLSIAGPGFVEKYLYDIDIAADRDTDVGTIVVTAGRSIAGRVLDPSGAPVPHARVVAGRSLTSSGGSELYMKDESLNAKDTETDDQGRFILDGFGPEVFTILAGKDALGRSPAVRLPASPDSITIDLVLQTTTGVEGKITRSGSPVADTIVIALPVGALDSSFVVTTGADGSFVLDSLAPGPYVIYPMIGTGGGQPKDLYVRRIELLPGARTHVDIDGTPGPITLAVGVSTDGGGSVTMAQVFALQATVEATTMDDLRDGSRLPSFGDQVIGSYIRRALMGSADIEGMRPGPHTICAIVVTGPVDDPGKLRPTCVHKTLDPSPKQRVEIVVPSK